MTRPGDLDPETKARIDAEEAYRAEARARLETPAGKRELAAKQQGDRKSLAAERQAALHRQIMEANLKAEQRRRYERATGPLAFLVYVVGGVLVFSGLAYWWSSRPSKPHIATAQELAAKATAAEEDHFSSFGYACSELVK